MTRVITGLDRIRDDPWKTLKGERLGLLANQASVDRHLTTAREVISRCFPGQLKALFGPQHGYGGEDQDNMVETPIPMMRLSGFLSSACTPNQEIPHPPCLT